MKVKNIFTLSLLFIGIHKTLAQNDFVPEVAFGVNSGFSLSSVNFRPTVKQNNLQSANGGLTFRYITEKHFGLLTEFNFVQRGWKENLSDTTLNYSRTLNYIELPFMTHLYFGKKKLRYIINLGPKIAYMISDKEIRNFTENNTESPQHGKKIDNRFDYGLCFGTGFDLHTGIGHFMLEGRYHYGLGDIFSNSKKEYFARSANQITQITLTYLIDFRK